MGQSVAAGTAADPGPRAAGPGPTAASSLVSLLGSPWGTKGMVRRGVQAGRGEAAGCWRWGAELTPDRLLHSTPVRSPPQHPPRWAHTPRDVAQPGAALVVPVLHGDTTAVPGKLSSRRGCSTTNGSNCLRLHSETSVTTRRAPARCQGPPTPGPTVAPPPPALPSTHPVPNAFGRDVGRQIARAGFSPRPCRLSTSVVRFPTLTIRLHSYDY